MVQRRRLQAQAHLQDVVIVRRDAEQGDEAVDEQLDVGDLVGRAAGERLGRAEQQTLVVGRGRPTAR